MIGILKEWGFHVWDFQRGQTRVQKHEHTDNTIDDCREQDTHASIDRSGTCLQTFNRRIPITHGTPDALISMNFLSD